MVGQDVGMQLLFILDRGGSLWPVRCCIGLDNALLRERRNFCLGLMLTVLEIHGILLGLCHRCFGDVVLVFVDTLVCLEKRYFRWTILSFATVLFLHCERSNTVSYRELNQYPHIDGRHAKIVKAHSISQFKRPTHMHKVFTKCIGPRA